LGVPLKSVLLAAHLKVLGSLTGRSDILTGIISHGRPEEAGGDRVLGLFLEVLPFRMRLLEEPAAALAARTFALERELYPFRRYPLARSAGTDRGAYFPTVFNFIDFHVYKDQPGPSVLGGTFFDPFPFTLKSNFIRDPTTSRLRLHLNYDERLLGTSRVEEIARRYLETLAALARP
jgi:microcystin synthetase protein McyA